MYTIFYYIYTILFKIRQSYIEFTEKVSAVIFMYRYNGSKYWTHRPGKYPLSKWNKTQVVPHPSWDTDGLPDSPKTTNLVNIPSVYSEYY